MLKPVTTTRFEKEIELAKRRGKDLVKLRNLMQQLINETPLASKHLDHPLSGKYNDRRECHIEPDWLLIYKVSGGEIIFERTGTHTDLFR